MKLVITPEEAGRLDAAAADRIDDLMDRAGYGVHLAASRLGAAYGARVVVLCGPGNNGGDGYVAARYLRRRGVSVVACAFSAPRAGTAAERALRSAQSAGVPVLPWFEEPVPADLVIDALFGSGFRGVFPAEASGWLGHQAPVLAVDVPSGLDAATGDVAGSAFSAAHTVTFHALKPGHLLGDGPEHCGELSLVDIGLAGGEAELMLCEKADAPRPRRRRTDHKWSAGSVVVVGGSPGLTGAPLLAAEAALHGGAGAVTLMCPVGLQPVYAAQAPGIMSRGVGRGTHFTEADVDEVLAAAHRFDVLAIGPGLGLDVGDFVTQLVLRWPKKLLIDADGINALDGAGALRARQSPTILTPHGGEFRRLTGEAPSHTAAHELAGLTGAVVVLKGNPTFVAGTERWVVTTGGPELATIGTGDVLAGLIAALWARGLDTEEAARSGAFWHGRAGSEMARGATVTASALSHDIGRFAW